jgi:Tol biopolymer transport system component
LRQATFSPHGGRIFVIAQLPFSANVRSGRSEIAEVSPVTGRVTRVLALSPPGAAFAPTVSPDGRSLAVWLLHQDRRKHLHFRLLLLDTGTLKVIASCRAPRDVITGLYFSPTGTKIAAVGNKAIYLFQIGFH